MAQPKKVNYLNNKDKYKEKYNLEKLGIEPSSPNSIISTYIS